LTDGVTAALAAPTPEALARRLVEVLWSPYERARLVAGADVAVERFSRERTVASIAVAAGQMLPRGAPAERVPIPEAATTVIDPRGLILDWLQPLIGVSQVQLGGDRSVGQTFAPRFDGLCRVDLRLERGTARDTDRIVVQIRRDPSATEDLAVASVPSAEVVAGHWTPFNFDPLVESAGQRFYARISCPDTAPGTGPCLAWCDVDAFGGGRSYRDDLVAGGTLPFRTFCRPAVRPAPLAPLAATVVDPLLLQLGSLNAEIEALDSGLARDQGSFPYRRLQPMVEATLRLARRAVGAATHRRYMR
jgi:hypothetical protein